MQSKAVMRPTGVVLGRLDPIHRVGIVTVLEGQDSIELVAADVAEEALSETIDLHDPGVVLVDEASADDRSIHRAISQHRQTRFLIFTLLPPSAHVAALLAKGADRFNKRASVEEIAGTMLLVAGGLARDTYAIAAPVSPPPSDCPPRAPRSASRRWSTH